MKKHVLVTILLLTITNCIGKQINIYDTQGKLKHTLEVGDYVWARVPYKSSYPNISDISSTTPADIFVTGQIAVIDDFSVKLTSSMFYNYSNDNPGRLIEEPITVERSVVLTLDELKALFLTNNAELSSGASVGLGIGGLLMSPIVSLGYGSGAFRTQRFINWMVVSATVIVVGTIVHALSDPGIYKFQEFNGKPNFRKYKQGTIKIE